jgi:hypothetical protein
MMVFKWGRKFRDCKTDLSSKLTSGWSRTNGPFLFQCFCLVVRLSLTVNIQTQLPQVLVKTTDCIFDRLHHVRKGIFLRGGPRIWRGVAPVPLCAAKVAAAGNSHVFGLCHRQPARYLGSQYTADDTDKLLWEGFPMRRLLRRKWGSAFPLQGQTLTTALPARSG